MNDNTTKLIEELAKKLGTTSEYLWSVLLKQAPIASTISSFIVLATAILGITLFRLHKKFSKKENKGHYSESQYDKTDALIVPMVIGVLLFVILFIVSVCELSSILSGYFNPEYWALKEILNTIDSH